MSSGKMRASRVLFIISLVIVLLIAGYFLYGVLDTAKDIKEAEANGESTAEGLGYALIVMLMVSWGSIVYGICTVMNIISYVLQKTAKDDEPHKAWSVVTFTFIFVPAIVEGLLLLIVQLL